MPRGWWPRGVGRWGIGVRGTPRETWLTSRRDCPTLPCQRRQRPIRSIARGIAMCGSLLREDVTSCLGPSERLYGPSSQEREGPICSARSVYGNPLSDVDSPDTGNTRRYLPFNRMDYAETYKGHFLFSRCLSSALQIRGIPGTAFHDGMLPWPYLRFPRRPALSSGVSFLALSQ